MQSLSLDIATERTPVAPRARVAVCGSYRRDRPGLLTDLELLRSARIAVTSPRDARFVDEVDGFVLAPDELDQAPEEVEANHLAAMADADFVWLHAPDGYVGMSAAMELGFARARAIPVFGRSQPSDIAFAGLVTVVSGPDEALEQLEASHRIPGAALGPLQEYYRRVAAARGYDSESPQDCMLLLTEEVGELARAVRKRAGLIREGGYDAGLEVAPELADVQLYLLHLANILDIDLEGAVRTKERRNAERHRLNRAA